jgi:hypothetical protein
MDRTGIEVRGTDTAVHGTRQGTRATVPFQRYLALFNGGDEPDPNEVLTAALPTSVRRRAGAFFTNPQLANALVHPFARDLCGDVKVVDPTCGAGDLLLAAARHFKKARDPERRVEEWEQRVVGRDLFEEFVLSARLRMYRAALPRPDAAPFAERFRGIQRGCSLTNTDVYEGASHVLLNPPYTLVRAPDDCEWRTGRVSAAAVFMERVVKHSEPGTRVGAILPDVLRSGSHYEKWRAMVGRLLNIDHVEIVGRFARWADVDVFLLHGAVRRSSSTSSWPSSKRRTDVLSLYCSVAVGPLVHYRAPATGPWRPYLTVDHARPWETISSHRLGKRRFEGRVFRPPFVVVRRTSRAGDADRMVATIITGTRSVAVENHLLVIVPFDRTESGCKTIVDRLRDPRTTRWLNKRIRCRHLTVGAVEDLPWWGQQ